MRKKAIIIIILLLLSNVLTGCGSNNDNKTIDVKNKIVIYTTVFPLMDFTEKIGGDHVVVTSVYPPGSDAHSFEPTPKEMTKIADADAFIYTGIGVEGFVTSALKTLENEKVIPVEAGHGIEFDSHEAEHEDHDHGNIDPHIWLDPILSIQMAENIKDALSEIQPKNKEEFEQNFQEVKASLEQLDKDFQQVVDEGGSKELLVSHAAYGYWEKRYGIHQLSISGYSPTEEPSQKELEKIIEIAKDHHLRYVIFEKNVNSKLAKVVQEELGAEKLTLHNLEMITEEESKNHEDYFSLMEDNIETLKKAFQ